MLCQCCIIRCVCVCVCSPEAFSTIKNALDDGVCQGWSGPLSRHHIRFIFIPAPLTFLRRSLPRAHLSSRKIPEKYSEEIFRVPISPLRALWHPPAVPQRVSPTSTRTERCCVIYHTSVPKKPQAASRVGPGPRSAPSSRPRGSNWWQMILI